MQRRDSIILEKILKEIRIGREMLGATSLEELKNDEKLKRALAMTVINIGELIKSVSDEMRSSHREVPWKAAAGMRDIAAHKYQTLRIEDVYNTVTSDFDDLEDLLTGILNDDGCSSK